MSGRPDNQVAAPGRGVIVRRRSRGSAKRRRLAPALAACVVVASCGGVHDPARDRRVPTVTGVAVRVGNERAQPIAIRLNGVNVVTVAPGATFDGATLAEPTPSRAMLEVVDTRTRKVVFSTVAARGQPVGVAITPVGVARLARPEDPDGSDHFIAAGRRP